MTSIPPVIRQATIHDANALAAVERACWPAELATTHDQIFARIKTFPSGQWVAVVDDTIVGSIYAQRITREFFESTDKQYDALTDHGSFLRSHDDQGEIYQMVGVSVIRAAKGLGLGRALVDQQIDHARAIKGIQRIIGFTRPVNYHRHADIQIEDYVNLRNEDGRRVDPVLSFHLDNGAKLAGAFANYRPSDHHARGFGVLIEYPRNR